MTLRSTHCLLVPLDKAFVGHKVLWTPSHENGYSPISVIVSDVALKMSRKTRPSRSGTTKKDETAVIPSYRDHPEDRTVCERRRVDGVSTEIADGLEVSLPDLQSMVDDRYGCRPGAHEARALPVLAFATAQIETEGTLPSLQNLQENGVTQSRRTSSLFFLTSPAGRYRIDQAPTGSAPKKGHRSGSRKIGLGQVAKLGWAAFVDDRLSIDACCQAFGRFHQL